MRALAAPVTGHFQRSEFLGIVLRRSVGRMDTNAAKEKREAADVAPAPLSEAVAPCLPETISLAEGFGLLGVSQVHFLKLVERGYIERASRGRHATKSVVQGYVRSLKEDKKGATRTAAENRVRDARAREIELRNAEREHQLIDLDEALGLVDEIIGAYRAEISGLPARFTRDRVLRAKLERETDEAQERVHARFVEAAASLRSGGQAQSTAPENPSG
jgi:hypothetical protein